MTQTSTTLLLSTLLISGSLTACTKGSETPSCLHDTGWTGDAGFNFKTENFACDATPIDGDFLLDEATLAVPSGIASTATAVAAFQDARSQWNAAASVFDIKYSGGNINPGVLANDNSHHVFMTNGYESDPDTEEPVAGTWAIATLHPTGSSLGEDCDLELFTHKGNADGTVSGNDWTDQTTPTSTTMYMGLIINHELGHCAGFKENSVASSVMNYATGGTGDPMPSLATVDEDALVRLYGP